MQCAAYQSYRQSTVRDVVSNLLLLHGGDKLIPEHVFARAVYIREATERYGDISSLSMSLLLCTIKVGYE